MAEALAGMRSQLAGLLAHEHAPLVLAQQASGVPAQLPLFTALFNYRHSQPRQQPYDDGRPPVPGIQQVSIQGGGTNYPLTVTVNDTGTRFALTIDAVAPGDPALVCGLLHTALGSLVTALEHAPGTPLRQVQVLGEGERAQIVSGWNDTAAAVPAGTLPELFEAQAARTPDAVAVACAGAAVSYARAERGGQSAGPGSGSARGGTGDRGGGGDGPLRRADHRAAGGAEGGGGLPAGGPGLPGAADRVHAGRCAPGGGHRRRGHRPGPGPGRGAGAGGR